MTARAPSVKVRDRAPFKPVSPGNATGVNGSLSERDAIAKRPDLELYQPDKRHPSPAGTYLTACTTYAAVYRKSPVGNAYTAGLDPKTARFLQEIAWETVQLYKAR